MHAVGAAREHGQQAAPCHGFHRLTLVAASLRRQAGQLQQGGRQIVDVRKARVHRAGLNTRHTGHDERHADAALARIKLVGGQGRGHGAGPARANHGVSAFGAQAGQVALVLPVQPQAARELGVRV